MREFTLYQADVCGQERNTSYPHKLTIQSAADIVVAVGKDHTCGLFRNDHRSNGDFLECDVDAMDNDNDHSDVPADWISAEQFAEEFSEVDFVLIPSRHNNKQKGDKSPRPRYHVLFPHKKIMDSAECAALKQEIHRQYPFFDDGALDAARFLYGSEVKEEDIVWHEGSMDIQEFLARNAPPVGTIPQGKRNSTLSPYAGRVVKRFGFSEESKAIFLIEADKCDPPLSDAELNKIWNSAGKFAKKVASAPGYVPPDEYNATLPKGPAGSLKPLDYSDIGQAKVLASEYGDELKYNQATDFLHYNGVIWEESLQSAVGATEQFLDLQLADAQLMVFQTKQALINAGLTEDDLDGKKPPKDSGADVIRLFGEYLTALGYLAFVMKRRDMRYIKSAMEASKPMLFVEYSELDKDEFLLNTPESTYDLRLGLMGKMEHRAADLITKVTYCEPGSKGTELWQDALQKTFCGDQELIDYVQEIVGLAAIGKVYVEALIIAYGEGRNGKSTFFNTIARVLGTYSWALSSDALIVGCRRNVKWEVTELKGRRFVIAAELEEGTRLSTSMLKQITSTDKIQGEKKFKDPSPFTPSHSTVLYTNHLPKVGAMDEGTWRRLIVIPFNAVFEKSSDRKNYADYLVEEAGPAVLSWIIEGAERVIAKGHKLTNPKIVQDAIDAYRSDNNWLSAFMEECCDTGETCRAKSGELYQEYRVWCERVGEFTRSAAEFSNTLINYGFEKQKTKKGMVFKGVSLKSAFDE